MTEIDIAIGITFVLLCLGIGATIYRQLKFG